MKIAVIGAGRVGTALGSAWAKAGHEVFYGMRDPAKANLKMNNDGNNVAVKTVSDAAAYGEAIAFCTPWPAIEEAIKSCGNLTGKIVIDCTNPLSSDFWNLAMGFDSSGAEYVASLAKGAKVYKTFNQTGWENMANPTDYPFKPVMFVCGDDAAGKETVLSLVSDIGFEALDAGGLEAARLLEPFGLLWIRRAKTTEARDFAFAIVHRK